MGPVGQAKKVGKIPISKMKLLKKGYAFDFMDERPEVNSKEWVYKQYNDDFLNRPQLDGYMADKKGDKYEAIEELNQVLKPNDKVLNLSFDPSGAMVWGWEKFPLFFACLYQT